MPRATADATTSLRSRAIRMLARRDYSRAELGHKLARHGAVDDVRSLLDEMQALGYLSDARFAAAVVRQKSGSASKRAIAHELAQKGVERNDADRAIGEAELDDETTLRALWARRYGVAPADDRDKARQIRFLRARGFALSAIFKLMREVVGR